MTPNMKLSIFMELKQRRLKMLSRRNKVTIPEYYNKADAEEILSWPEHKALGIWDSICKSPLNGLLAQSCPYCHFCSFPEEEEDTFSRDENNPDCNSCTYAQGHGICGDNGSDWNGITRNVHHTNLSRKWYARAIGFINYMEGKE